jgi:AraC-like DNA-binding protein
MHNAGMHQRFREDLKIFMADGKRRPIISALQVFPQRGRDLVVLALTASAGVIWLLAAALNIAGVAVLLRDEHISLAMAVLVYGIGYMGLRQPEVFRYETAEYPIPAVFLRSPAPPPPPPDETPLGEAQPVEVSPVSRYERSGLGESEAQRLKAALLAIMDEEQPWKESDLTLADLAIRLESTPHKLSEVLNAQIGQTFYDFVNSYRVRDVQRRIEAGEARARKMLALALDAGFASKSTFNQAFKKHTSQTPSDFRQAVGA